MPERPKGVDSKSTVSLWHRGFESLSLRHFMKTFANLSFYALPNLFSFNHLWGTVARLVPAHSIVSGYKIFLLGQRIVTVTKVPGKELSVVSPEFRAN